MVTLLSPGGIAPGIGFGAPGVQGMMPLSADTLLLISDGPRERVLEVRVETGRGLVEPWWAIVNRVAWLTSKRYVIGRSLGDLQAAELLVHRDDRRRDLHDPSPDDAMAAIQRSRDDRGGETS